MDDPETYPFADCPDDPSPPARPFAANPEPLPASFVFAPALAAESPVTLLQGIADPAGVPHPFDGLCKVCVERRDAYLADCKLRDVAPSAEPPVAKLEILWRKIDHPRSPGWFAVNCCDACYDFAKRDTAREARNREAWEKVCPPDFRSDWDSTKADRSTLEKVMKFDPLNGRGLLIHGQTGASKTRAAWALARKLAESGTSFLFIESIDLLESFPAEAESVAVLFIDDFGQDHLKGANEVRLLKLIRTRTNWRRPIVLTTQFDGEKLTEKFSDTGTAKAVIRRLRQSCDAVYARPMKSAT